MRHAGLFLMYAILTSCSSLTVLEAKDEYGFAITGQTLHLFKDEGNSTEKKLHGRRYQKEFDRIKSRFNPGGEELIPQCIFINAIIKGNDTIYGSPKHGYWKYKGKIVRYQSDIFKEVLVPPLPDSILANYDVLD